MIGLHSLQRQSWSHGLYNRNLRPLSASDWQTIISKVPTRGYLRRQRRDSREGAFREWSVAPCKTKDRAAEALLNVKFNFPPRWKQIWLCVQLFANSYSFPCPWWNESKISLWWRKTQIRTHLAAWIKGKLQINLKVAPDKSLSDTPFFLFCVEQVLLLSSMIHCAQRDDAISEDYVSKEE